MIKLRPNIFVGGMADVQGKAAADIINAEGITAILNVAYEVQDPPMYPSQIRQVKIGMSDNNENVPYMKDLAVMVCEKMMDEGEVILVHCAAGLSRSVYTAVMAVANKEDKEPHDVFDELQMNHPWAMYGPLFTGTNRLYRHYKDLEEGKDPFADESTAQKA